MYEICSLPEPSQILLGKRHNLAPGGVLTAKLASLLLFQKELIYQQKLWPSYFIFKRSCLFENQTPVQKVFGQGNKDPKNFIWAGEGGVQHSQKTEISKKNSP